MENDSRKWQWQWKVTVESDSGKMQWEKATVPIGSHSVSGKCQMPVTGKVPCLIQSDFYTNLCTTSENRLHSAHKQMSSNVPKILSKQLVKTPSQVPNLAMFGLLERGLPRDVEDSELLSSMITLTSPLRFSLFERCLVFECWNVGRIFFLPG